MYTLELAREQDIELCYQIVDEGREFQKEQGFTQWTDDYPNIDIIRNDVQKEKGFVVKVDGVIAGYVCVDFDGEPAYKNIEGEWRTEQPYAVVHRIAISKMFRGRGLADVTFELIEERCMENNMHYIRMDTHLPNKRMQHVLTKNGYVNCGFIIFQGKKKLVYDKIL